jgi:hypothetical protein
MSDPQFSEKAEHERAHSLDEKKISDVEVVSKGDSDEAGVLDDAREIATNVITVEDDPTLSPWSVRAFVIGIGMSAFGGVLAEIYYFKPQTVLVSTMFIAVISYILGIAWETFLPQRGYFRYINPGPFNKKENAFIVIMASAAANAALGTEVLAVQRLYYNITPNPAASVLYASQNLRSL